MAYINSSFKFILIYSITRVLAENPQSFLWTSNRTRVEGYVEEMMIGQRVIKSFPMKMNLENLMN